MVPTEKWSRCTVCEGTGKVKKKVCPECKGEAVMLVAKDGIPVKRKQKKLKVKAHSNGA